ncbi:hypothetical protein AAF712_006664 [Marasmius tenuissimus]|uniref:Uncharacterized protein n=1 Tax=Marasmius tenuissimus TaxID=585030 RepID=A0ABR2ZZM8_9AGAR
MAFGPSPETVSGYEHKLMDVDHGLYESSSNNEGITIVDITNIEDPSYCYKHHGKNPLNAKEYTEISDHKPTLDETLAAYFEELQVISPSVLAVACPQTSRTASDSLTRPKVPKKAVRCSLPTLADLVLGPTIQQAIQSEDASFSEILEPFFRIPEKVAAILDALRAGHAQHSGENPFYGRNVLAFISKIVEANPTRVILTDLEIPSNGLIEVLSVLEESHPVEYLNVSNNKNVTIETLRAILEDHPNIHRLVLYGTSITDDDLESLYTKSYGNWSHPAFSFFFNDPEPMLQPRYSSLASTPLLKPSVVLQSISDLCSAWTAIYSSEDPYDLHRQAKGIPMLSSGPSSVDGKWYQRPIICSPFPSGKAFREGWMFVMILSNPIRYGTNSSMYGFLRPKAAASESSPSEFGRGALADYEVHDLSSFLAELKVEGYPEPPANLVESTVASLERFERAGLIAADRTRLPRSVRDGLHEEARAYSLDAGTFGRLYGQRSSFTLS